MLGKDSLSRQKLDSVVTNSKFKLAVQKPATYIRIHLEQDRDRLDWLPPRVERAGDRSGRYRAARNAANPRMRANTERANSRERRPYLLPAPATGAKRGVLFNFVTVHDWTPTAVVV